MFCFFFNNTQIFINLFVRGPFAEVQILLAPGQVARVSVILGRKGLVGFDVTTNQLALLRPIKVTGNNQVFLLAGGTVSGPPVQVSVNSPVFSTSEAADATDDGNLIQQFDDIPSSGL